MLQNSFINSESHCEMNEDLISKHRSDPAWAEIIRLYSGLFDSKSEREEFIIDLAETDILLAAECKTSSVEIQDELKLHLSNKAASLISNNSNTNEEQLLAFSALSELERFDIISNYLENLKGRDIPQIRNLLTELNKSVEAKNVLLTAVNSKPSIFIYTFLETIGEFEQEKIFLSQEEINNVFNLIIENKLKANHVFAFLKKYALDIYNIHDYLEYCVQSISEIVGFDNLSSWLTFFKIKIPDNDLIDFLCESGSTKALHNVFFLLQKMNVQSQIIQINKLFNSNENLKTLAIIFIGTHKNLKLRYFKQIKSYNFNITVKELDNYAIFFKVFSKTLRKIKNNESISEFSYKINKALKVGDVIKCKLLSKRLKYYLVQNVDFSMYSNVLSYIIPLQESPNIIESVIRQKKIIDAKIIHIDIFQKKIFLSVNQLHERTVNLKFSQNYLYDIEIGEIVICSIGYRHENRVNVKIHGLSKKQRAVIFVDPKIVEGYNRVKARVKRIKDQVIHLDLIELLESTNNKDIKTDLNYTSLTDLMENHKIGIVQKLIILISERFGCDKEFKLVDLNSKIGHVTRRSINSLFPSKTWFINYLEQNGYVKKMTAKKNIYIFIKPLRVDSFDKLNNELNSFPWSNLSSFNHE